MPDPKAPFIHKIMLDVSLPCPMVEYGFDHCQYNLTVMDFPGIKKKEPAPGAGFISTLNGLSTPYQKHPIPSTRRNHHRVANVSFDPLTVGGIIPGRDCVSQSIRGQCYRSRFT